MSSMKLSADQNAAIDRLFEFDHTILVADTGVGKTVIALTAIQSLIEETDHRKIIVAVPAKVLANMVWPNEAAKWQHLRGLSLVQLEGTSMERTKRLMSTMGEVDILLVSLNNLDWLLQQDHECDGIVIDELSKASGKWSKGLRSRKGGDRLRWRCGMTATPVSQSFEKLYSMARIIDHGQSLGTNKENYLREYFYPEYNGQDWTVREGSPKRIMAKVASLVHVVPGDKAETLPPVEYETASFDMPDDTRVVYDDMRRHMVIEELELEAANQAVKSGKLRQIASGFVYHSEGEATPLDRARAEEALYWWGHVPTGIIFYEYIEQAEMLIDVFNNNIATSLEDFKGEAPTVPLLAQINSMSHGVDGLQHLFNNVLFYHPMWSRDATEQAIGRVWRQGQTKPVTVTTLFCNNTLDGLVTQRVTDRAVWMKMFKQHLGEGR